MLRLRLPHLDAVDDSNRVQTAAGVGIEFRRPQVRRVIALHPYSGQVENGITQALADPVEEKTLHMITADPARKPTLVQFAPFQCRIRDP